MKIQANGKPKELSASEALYGFGGWLTTRKDSVTMSSTHNAGIVAELIDQFCKTNSLPEPREDWSDNLVHPKEDLLRTSRIVPVGKPSKLLDVA